MVSERSVSVSMPTRPGAAAGAVCVRGRAPQPNVANAWCRRYRGIPYCEQSSGAEAPVLDRRRCSRALCQFPSGDRPHLLATQMELFGRSLGSNVLDRGTAGRVGNQVLPRSCISTRRVPQGEQGDAEAALVPLRVWRLSAGCGLGTLDGSSAARLAEREDKKRTPPPPPPPPPPPVMPPKGPDPLDPDVRKRRASDGTKIRTYRSLCRTLLSRGVGCAPKQWSKWLLSEGNRPPASSSRSQRVRTGWLELLAAPSLQEYSRIFRKALTVGQGLPR